MVVVRLLAWWLEAGSPLALMETLLQVLFRIGRLLKFPRAVPASLLSGTQLLLLEMPWAGPQLPFGACLYQQVTLE